MIDSSNHLPLLEGIRALILQSRQRVLKQVNQTMVVTYFEIGKMIFENIQNSADRAKYSDKLMKTLSGKLTADFGRGFSYRNLNLMRQFFRTYQNRIVQTLSAQSGVPSGKVAYRFNLSWSHYVFLLKIPDTSERSFYEIESAENNWSLRELKRQFNSALFERLVLSKNKKEVATLAQKGQVIEKPADLIKDPYILEFLGMNEMASYSETELETGLIDKLQHFLLELGKGFTFVARQKRISFGEKHFHIDLVLFNRILQCFFIIDLKIGELGHKDFGQVQMYVNYYDREIRLPHENKTIGLVLCKTKENAVVEYTLPADNKQIFASQYQMVLPDKKALLKILQEEE